MISQKKSILFTQIVKTSKDIVYDAKGENLHFFNYRYYWPKCIKLAVQVLFLKWFSWIVLIELQLHAHFMLFCYIFGFNK